MIRYKAHMPETETPTNNGGFLGGLGYLGNKVGIGFMQTFEGAWDYAAGGIADLFGADEWARRQMENDWFGDWYYSADKNFNPGKGWKIAGDVAGGIGNVTAGVSAAALAVASAVGITMATGGTGLPVSASVIGGTYAALTAGLGAAGNATKEAYAKTGELTGKEYGYGALVGATEGVIEGASNLIAPGAGKVAGKVGKGLYKAIAGEAAENAAKTGLSKVLGTAVKHAGTNFISEAVEEGTAEILAPQYAKLTYDPNAENATPEEVIYASFIGGLSGVLAGGGEAAILGTYDSVANYRAGKKAVEAGYTAEIEGVAKRIAEEEAKKPSGYALFEKIREVYERPGSGYGRIGALQRMTAASHYLPAVEESAKAIVSNPEYSAARFLAIGAKNPDGTPLEITPEKLTEGFDRNADSETALHSLRRALSTNPLLLTLSVADATGKMMLDAENYAGLLTGGGGLTTRGDYQTFLAQASDEQKAAVAQHFGLTAPLDAIPYEDMVNIATGYAATPEGRAAIEAVGNVRYRAEQVEKNEKPLPKVVGEALADGIYRYGDVAIIKEGGSVRIYDYETRSITMAMTPKEATAALQKYRREQDTAKAEERRAKAEEQRKAREEELDTWAREHIKRYRELVGNEQREIRTLIRQGRALGLSDADIETYATVSARSSVRVTFSKAQCRRENVEMKDGKPVILVGYADGFYSPETNEIVVNPEGKRSAAKLLMHELSHALYKNRRFAEVIDGEVKHMDEKRKKEVRELYEKAGKSEAEISEDLSVHHVEDVVGNRDNLARMMKEEPTLGDKILSFFKLAKTDYKGHNRLSLAAGRLYRTFESILAGFSEFNRGNLVAEAVVGVGDSKGIRDAIKYPHYTESDIKSNTEALADMEPVSTVDASKLKKTGKSPKEIFSEYFASLGNSLYSDEFGDIALGNSSVKSEIRHGLTAEKIASIEAIPNVIAKGKVIFSRKKSGTDVERILVAAPIKIGDVDYYMGVMLQRDSAHQRLYLHNVATITKEEATTTSQDDSLTNWSDEGDSLLLTTIILQKAMAVKKELNKISPESNTMVLRHEEDGAVTASTVTDSIVSAFKSGRRDSITTEFEPLPKQEMSLTTGEGTILHSIQGLESSPVKGLGGNSTSGFTGRAVRGWAMRANGFTDAQVGNVDRFMDDMAKFMEEAGVKYRFIGLTDVKNAKLHYTYNADGSIKSIVLSAMVKNGDYPVNFDLSSICKKRVAMSTLIDKLAKRGALDDGTVALTPTQIFMINTALKNAGYETACLGCFVESKRYNAMSWARSFVSKWNAAVKAVNPNATYFGFGDGTASEEVTAEQAAKIDAAAQEYIANTKTKRMEQALAKYKERQAKGLPLITSKVNGKEVATFSNAARDRIAKSETISDALKERYLTADVETLGMADVEFLLENGVLPGASISNKQSVTALVKSGESYQHLLRPSDLLTAKGIEQLEALPNFHGVLYGHYGSGTPKLMQSFTPYNSEIALLPAKKAETSLAEYLYSIAGVRMQSFSDFQVQNIYDYLQMVADLAAKKLPAHAYTKEISFARLLGMTGIKVNLSVMFDIDPTVDSAHAGLTRKMPLIHKGEYAKAVLHDDQGDWVYNVGDYQTQRAFAEADPDADLRFLQSIGFADAVKLQTTEGYSANCGIIGVGYSDLHILAMLDDSRVRYIIPYHASSLPADIKVATNIALGTDYTPVQNTMKIDSIVDKNGKAVEWSVKEAFKRLGSGKAVLDELNAKIKSEGWVVKTKKAQNGHGTYGLYEDLGKTSDPRKTAENFMDWCCGNGTLPLFYQFASHENYYKLLYDFNVYDCVSEQYAPQTAVTNTYPAGDAAKPTNAADGGFDATNFIGILEKQMAFMNRYSESLDSDLDAMAASLTKGRRDALPATTEELPNGTRVRANDRGNIGVIVGHNAGVYSVKFTSKDGLSRTLQMTSADFSVAKKTSTKKTQTASAASSSPIDTTGSVGKNKAEYKATFGDKVFTASTRTYIDTVDELYGIVTYLRKVGKIDKTTAEAMVQQARAARSQAQTMIGSAQYNVFSDKVERMGDGLLEILKPAQKWSEEKRIAFDDYLLHQLNIDRMTLESRSFVWAAPLRRTVQTLENNLAALENRKKQLTSDIGKKQTALNNAKVRRGVVKTAKAKEVWNKQVDTFARERSALNDLLKEATRDIAKKKKELGKAKEEYEAALLKNKPVFGKDETLDEDGNMKRDHDITADESRDIVKKYDAAHPEFANLAKRLYAYLDNVQKLRVEAGIITQDMADRMKQLYPHYVPSYRDVEGGGISSIKGKNAMEVSKTVRKAKGGNQDILDVSVSIAMQTDEVLKAGQINKLARALYDAAKASGDDTYVKILSEEVVGAQEDAVDAVMRPKPGQLTFYADGKRVTLEISKELLSGFDGLRKPSVDFESPVMQALAFLNTWYKRGVTSLNPAFAIRNPIRDFQDAGLNSKHPLLFAKQMAGLAQKGIASNSERWELYRAMGGFSSTVFDGALHKQAGYAGFESISELFSAVEGETDLKAAWRKLSAPAKALFRSVENANAFLEQTTRFAEFCASLDAGDSPAVALNNSAEVTTNFGRRGRITKVLNATVMPFLNPAVQGFDKLFRNVGDAFTGGHWVRGMATLITKAAIIGIAPMLLNSLMYDDDEEYKKLRETDKENNFLIKTADGTFIKIPRGRLASVIGGLYNRGDKLAKGEDAELAGYASNVVSQITPVENVSRTIFSPIFDVKNNRTWYGGEIEGREWDDTAPRDRYDESTSSIAVWIGQAINYSPKKVHYLLDQYSGVIGDFVLPATSKKEKRDFFSGNFTLDSVTSNKLSERFYDAYDKTAYADTAGDEAATYRLKYLNDVKKAVRDMNKELDEIRNSDLSNTEKLQQTRVVRSLINAAYDSSLKSLDAVNAAIEETAGIEDEVIREAEVNRRVFGAEYALKQYNEKTYEKYVLLNGGGIGYDELYAYHFATLGIESDLDKRGNVIEGSKKKKILAVINSLNIPKEQKLILLYSRGYSAKDGDIEGVSAARAKTVLAAYIAKAKGLTKAQREELAKACGLKVTNGRISVK